MIIDLYTDGACVPNPGRGAYAAVASSGKLWKTSCSGGYRRTTNNRMEIYGVIHGLAMIYGYLRENFHPCPHSITIKVHSDSKYVINTFQNWIVWWRKRNFHKKDGMVPNFDLWRMLDAVVVKPPIPTNFQWVWVKGHAGIDGNEHCDQACLDVLAGPTLQADLGYESPPKTGEAPPPEQPKLKEVIQAMQARLDALEKEVFGPAVDVEENQL